MKFQKGDLVRGGPARQKWTGRVISVTKNVLLVWTTGKLKGYQARVPSSTLEMVKRKAKP